MERIETFVLNDKIKSLPFYVELAGISYPDPNYEVRRVNSDITVLEYVIEGSGTVEIGGKAFTVFAGDVYILPQGENHHYYSSKSDPFKKIWMNVSGGICRSMINLYGLSGKYHFKNIDLYGLFEEFINICRDKDSDVRDVFDRCSLKFAEIIQRLSRHIEKSEAVNAYAASAMNYCMKHIYEKLSVEDVAEYAGISVSQLNRIFKAEYGCTVYSYILDNKLSLAKSLLREPLCTSTK